MAFIEENAPMHGDGGAWRGLTRGKRHKATVRGLVEHLIVNPSAMNAPAKTPAASAPTHASLSGHREH